MQSILVTGGAGYIGSHICKELACNGYKPIVFDNLIRGHRDNIRWGPFVHGDVRSIDTLTSAIREYNIDSVVHCAALAYVGESCENPSEYYSVNVIGGLTLLEAIRLEGIHTLVLSSSCAVYGSPDILPVSESAPMAPISPYGRTKYIMEMATSDACGYNGLSSISLRYFNAAGADSDGTLAERHDPETHIIPNILMGLSGSKQSVLLNGVDFDTIDGTCVRDYVHVTDIAKAHLLALKYAETQSGYDTFNLGTGTGFSIREIISEAESLTGLRLRVEEGPRRQGDPPYLVADPAKARKFLQWEPLYSDITTIISDAWHHFSKGT
jgi:UDP-arabinose 4-epimerase